MQGNVLARYKVERELGRGATGAVYAARDRTTGALVALKRLDPAVLATDAGAGDRLRMHARAAQRLAHAGIVRTLDAGEAAGTFYVAMEMLEGESLRKVLDAGPLPVARAIRVAREVAAGLAHAHLEGVIHAGLKPSNILVLPSGTVKITDFGLAQPAPGYQSPEQGRGEAVDHRSDLYSLGVAAQDYPARRVQIVVPYTAGGSSDFVARTVAAKISGPLGQPVIVENRPGGNAHIGTEFVAKSAPDGYTLLLAGMTTHAAAPALYRKLSYDPIKDFAPITNAIDSPIAVVAHPSVPANSLQELIAYAKANPGKLNYGSAGVGNTLHLAGEVFRSVTGVDIVHVPYKGASQALGDLLGGRIQLMFDLPQTPLSNIQAGKLKALAVTGNERLAILPNAPTAAEAGVPGFRFATWIGLVAPAGTPAPVVQRLHREIVTALAQPDVKDAFAQRGMVVAPSESPEAYARFIRSEIDRLGQVIRAAKIEPE